MRLNTTLTDAERRAHEVLDQRRDGQWVSDAQVTWALRQLGDLPGIYLHEKRSA